ncbi:hypothetical protein CUMW_139090 [Citrus unshiu]|uniref:AMP-binding enzyme C-terminal domain-containing protein n=1 Tax=Citrus unshiu TaxID=55188 RepID=A0A2H5PI94_CITUN|nr:hypothetical protein CUMW_139090 [Citrus unshiu]
MISNSPDFEPLKTVQILTAGAHRQHRVLSRTESWVLCSGSRYGLTEGRTGGCTRGKTEGKARSEDVGLAEVDVVNPETGESVKRDGVSLGEVVLRGGCVTVGYFKDKEATRRCISDNGWFYTGDIGVMHADGYVEIKDRSKDVIISGGENICSAEVESVLYSITAVNEAAVVARPDMFWGEIPCAFVSLKRDLELTEKPTEKEIIEYCRARLPRYMVPRKVVFSEELPKTSTGKIQKYLLREFAKSVS